MIHCCVHECNFEPTCALIRGNVAIVQEQRVPNVQTSSSQDSLYMPLVVYTTRVKNLWPCSRVPVANSTDRPQLVSRIYANSGKMYLSHTHRKFLQPSLLQAYKCRIRQVQRHAHGSPPGHTQTFKMIDTTLTNCPAPRLFHRLRIRIKPQIVPNSSPLQPGRLPSALRTSERTQLNIQYDFL